MSGRPEIDCNSEEYDQAVVEILETLKEADFPETTGASWNVVNSHRY